MSTKAVLEQEVESLRTLSTERKQEMYKAQEKLKLVQNELVKVNAEVRGLVDASLQARAAIAAFMAAHYAAAQVNTFGAIEGGNYGNQLDGIKEPTQFEANGLLLLHLSGLLQPLTTSGIDGMRPY